MSNSQKTILWDFDGTLIQFASWRGALMRVLDELEPGHNIDQEQIRPFLRDGFPWHKPDEPHLHLSTPDAWWANLEPLFVRAYQGVGFTAERAQILAKHVRKHMLDPGRYIMFDDTMPVLKCLKENGWRNVVLSNHMPELPDMVKVLQLSRYIDACFVSAITGYEKPNPQAFRLVLESINYPEIIWMVGDNLLSDIKGAEAMGIPAILVRNPETEGIKYHASDLFGVVKIIEENYQSH